MTTIAVPVSHNSVDDDQLRVDDVRVLVIDDHPLVREGLERIVAARAECSVVGSADSIESAIRLDLPRVDVCTLDLSLPGMGGLEGISALQQRWPSVRVLVISMHPEGTHAQACVHRGASGFISKSAAPDDIRSAVLAVAAGVQYFSSESLATTAGGPHVAPALSTRELQVLRLLEDGSRLTDIARMLGVSIKTASAHKMRLQHKLGASNTAQIVVIARAKGVLP